MLTYGYLIDSLLMASTLKLGGEELIHDGFGCLFAYEAARHDKHIGIVVLTDEVSNLGQP